MKIDKETALRLWNQEFGRKQKAFDFAGRQIAKAAYNDRESKFGWNVDHILPESRGGKTADYNLKCCHIKTNDEKADKFPCFKANEQVFEIVRRQNHYEIHSKNKEDLDYNNKEVNFLDFGQGLDFLNNYEIPTKNVFVGDVKIQIKLKDHDEEFLNCFFAFLRELFSTTLIFPVDWSNFGAEVYYFNILDFDIPNKEDTKNLLNKCIILNTYVKYYFQIKYNCKIKILYSLHYFESRFNLGNNELKNVIWSNGHDFFSLSPFISPTNSTLAISSGIAHNANIKYISDDMLLFECNQYKCSPSFLDSYLTYDCVFKKLKNSLEKYMCKGENNNE